MPAVIAADQLTKWYGKTRGVEGLTFEVEQGEVFGYLGPNGAGKSTTIRTMLDFIRPTSGRVTILGMDAQADAVAIRRAIGYVPGEFGLYERLTGERYLRDFAAFRGGVDWRRVSELADQLKLDLSFKIASLSHGNKRKVALLQAFMHEPDVLILDEPTQGLDPLVQQEFYRLIDEVRARGGTVFISSHVMPEVERVCDRVAIIREGRLVTVADIGELKAAAVRSLELHFDGIVPVEAFSSLPSVTSAQARGDSIVLTVRGPVDEVIKEAAKHTVVTVATHEPSLEDIFLDVYRNGGAS